MNHADEMTCLLYLDGQLEAARAAELAAHLRQCRACGTLLAALEQETHLVRRALGEEAEPVPARLLEPPRERAAWAWVVSLGFAALGALTLWTQFIEPWQQQLQQVGLGSDNLLSLLLFGGIFWEGWPAMLKLVESLAVLAMGSLGLVLLRRWMRRRPGMMTTGWTVMALGLVLAVLALPSAAAAAEVRKERTYHLGKDEVIHNDLILYAGSARIDGTVEGDLIVFAGEVTVTGRVTGDVLAFARMLRIEGEVEGDVRTFANTLMVTGQVHHNLTTFAETTNLDPGAQIGGGVLAFVSRFTLEDARIARDLLLMSDRPEVDGFVGGNLTVYATRLSIGSGAEVQGQARYKGHEQPDVSAQARLASPLEIEIEARVPRYLQLRFYWHQALRWAAGFVLGAFLLLILPGFYRDLLGQSERIAASLGLGLLGLIGTPIIAILVCLTIIGLALGIGTLLVYIVAAYAGHVIFSAWLGRRLLGPNPARGALFAQLALGLAIVRVAVSVPYVGWLFGLAATAWGFGALTLALYHRARPQPAAAPAA